MSEQVHDVAVKPRLLELAQTAPRIAIDDSRIAEFQAHKGHKQFGNNFHLLWLSMQPEWPEDSPLKTIYADRLLAWEGWPGFARQNSELLEEIRAALQAKEPADELFQGYVELMNGAMANREDATARQDYINRAEALNAAVEHPLGIEAVVIHAWDRLNPLLETVAQKLDTAGLDPSSFYG